MNLEQQNTTPKAATRDGFGQGMLEIARQNPNVFALCADLTESMRLNQFKNEFPNRFIQVGVAEQNLIGVAAGLALGGKIPFATSFAVFSPGRSWDQIRVSVAYGKLNVKIIGGHAGLVTGPDGASHQALEDIAIMRTLPNMKVIEPADSFQATQAVYALASDKGPTYLRLSRPKVPTITQNLKFTIGKSQTLHHGNDATIIACGAILHEALRAARKLATENISVRVINMHTIKPIDTKVIIKAAQESKIIITAEDHQIFGGLGSAVAEVISKNINQSIKNEVKFAMVGVEDTFGESGSPQELKEKYKISDQNIIKKIKTLLNE